MPRGRRRLGLLVVAVSLATAAASLGAQGAPRLQELDVALWPEYDRPSVLVMYRASLAPASPMPTTVTLRIPAAVGAPTAVAEAEPGGNLVNASYDRRVEGDWAILTIEATRPRLQVEYYDPRLQRDGSRRSFEYGWPGMPGVERLEVTVQEPVGAREMSVEPAPDRRGEAADGLVYHTLAVPEPAEPVAVRLEYTKDTDALSVESLEPMAPTDPTAPGQSSAAPTATGDDVPRWVVALVVLAAVGGGVGWWMLSRRGGSTQVRGSSGSPAGGSPAADEGGSARRFCTRCGGRVGPEDKFCASCGSRLGG